MRIEDTDYVVAAQERLSNARLLYEAAQYSFDLYAAGVAVEALLRAFVTQKEPVLEAAHNLILLLRESRLRDRVSALDSQRLHKSVNVLSKRWKNDLRYTSNNRLRRRLKKQKLDRGLRGDFLKENCRIAIDMAETVLKIGVPKWNP